MTTISGYPVSFFQHIQSNQYTEVAATTLVWYDYFLTLNDEIQFFWGRRLTWTAFLFFANRYLILITQTFNTYPQVSSHVGYILCKVSVGFILTGSGVVQELLVDTILCIRIYAMYGRSKLVLYSLGTLLGVCTLASLSVVAAIGIHTKGTATPAQGIHHCTIVTPFKFLWAYWVPILVYESTGFLMVFYKAFQHIRHSNWQDTVTEISQSTTSSLMTVLYRDSLIYFAVIFGLYVATCVLFASQDPSVNGMMDGPTISIIAILGNRVLFNLRASDARSTNTTDTSSDMFSTELREMSFVRFAGASQGTTGTLTQGPPLGEELEEQLEAEGAGHTSA